MCCNVGCVDDAKVCQPGTYGTACGASGSTCETCAAGDSCVAGACVTECAAGGTACTINGVAGRYGNGNSAACVCCATCFDPNSGECVTSGDLDCGIGGEMCATCGGSIPYCANGVCAMTP